jgi:Kazal-type serine protease inhibitor domain
MKTALLVVLLILTVGEEANSKVTTTAACPTIFDPVCGVKHKIKKNYDNDCLAENDGANDITKGFCERGRRKHKK